MKAAPTDIDREAARLFTVGRGMTYGRECAGSVVWNVSHGQDVEADAIDTDDPATVGCMLAQVEQAEGLGMTVEVYRVGAGWFSTDCRCGAGGPTRGAALVAAMRQIKAKNAKEMKT